MGRERQKKKNRSSISKVKPKNHGRTKAGKKKVDFLGNEIISKNWNRKLTVSQNYERLGLSAKLNDPTGGKERSQRNRDDERNTGAQDDLAIPGKQSQGQLSLREAQVERDLSTGRILRVIPSNADLEKENRRPLNPLNDPLNDLDIQTGDGQHNSVAQSDVVTQLEAQAAGEADKISRSKRPRQQSGREEDWIARLVKRHGDNVMAMVRDRKLNPMQQTEGDIRRRLRIWRKKNSELAAVGTAG